MVRLTAELIQQAPARINPLQHRELDLRGCKIPMIENLGATLDQFDCIDLCENELRRLGDFPLLKRVKTLYLHHNRIAKIDKSLGTSLPNLEDLYMDGNSIASFADLQPLLACRQLRRLSLRNTPVSRVPGYRLFVLALLPKLRFLDFAKVKWSERKQGIERFGGQGEAAEPRMVTLVPVVGDAAPSNGAASGSGTAADSALASNGRVDGTDDGDMDDQASEQGVTPELQAAIQLAIQNASSLEEMQRLQRILASGNYQEIAAAVRQDGDAAAASSVLEKGGEEQSGGAGNDEMDQS